MYWLLILVFVLGYMMIAFEHPLKIDKAASAILTGVLCWTVLIFGADTLLVSQMESTGHDELQEFIHHVLIEHVGEIAQILFFLLGAMTIVELIDAYRGFEVVTKRITTTNKVKLIWLISIITFFFSAALDNLTTAIVMSTLLKKLISKKEDLWFFGGMVIIAANAGGAWSPIGDVTTIMLWIGGQITALSIIEALFIPSLLCLIVPLLVLTFVLKGDVDRPELVDMDNHHSESDVTSFHQRLIFWMGVAGLLFVPVFKNVTHLPPFMGILLSLGLLWITTEIIHRNGETHNKSLSVAGVIQRIDTPSILFFLGILLAVAGLQTSGHLGDLATALDKSVGNIYIINALIGVLSAVVDNVPLVAGAMGMYSMETFPQDNVFWNLLAYCAGTGGSMLIIGSAAGVATMGILKIDFIWYLRKVGWVAALGYFAGFFYMYLLH